MLGVSKPNSNYFIKYCQFWFYADSQEYGYLLTSLDNPHRWVESTLILSPTITITYSECVCL
jgi:hypothetical protein